MLAAVVLGAALLVVPPAAADPGSTTLVGLGDDGTAPDNGSGFAAISADGSVVAFLSSGSDVDEDAPAGAGLFVRDRASSTTEAVDFLPDGTFGPGGVGLFDLSSDGRYVVFDRSRPGACSNPNRECTDVYRRDLQANTTEMVSVAPDGAPAEDGDSFDPEISADGQRVVFTSYATDLVAGEEVATSNIYVRDLVTGTTQMVSLSSDEVAGNQDSFGPAISADGSTVAFSSSATNLAAVNPSTGSDVYVRDLGAGTTTSALPGGRSYAFGQSEPTLSEDGSTVAFSTRTDLQSTGEPTTRTRAYVIDRTDDTITSPSPHEFEVEDQPQLSNDGRHLAYRASRPTGSASPGLYVFDRQAGSTELESVGSDGAGVQSQVGPQPMSGDARFVVFDSLESLYPSDPPDTLDAFVHDRAEQGETASGTSSASTANAGGPTYDDVLDATVSGSPGEVTITELETEDPDAQPIEGYAVLGQQVRVTADPATPPNFLTFTFDLDSSIVPGYAGPADVDVFRNGSPLPACAAASDVGPCVDSRTVLPSGDWRFVAHSPEASVWAVALDQTFTPAPADSTPPTINVTRPVQGASYVVGQAVTASYTCTDTDSGIAMCTGTRADGAALSTGSIGAKSFTVTATDNAGNTSTRTIAYRVVWPLQGYQQPIDNPPVVNTVKAGAVVPARFTLGGYRGTQIFASGYPIAYAQACPGEPSTDEIEQTLGTSAATLTYRQGVYTYAWRTQKSWVSTKTCRRLVVRFKDGQQLNALFRLR